MRILLFSESPYTSYLCPIASIPSGVSSLLSSLENRDGEVDVDS